MEVEDGIEAYGTRLRCFGIKDRWQMGRTSNSGVTDLTSDLVRHTPERTMD